MLLLMEIFHYSFEISFFIYNKKTQRNSILDMFEHVHHTGIYSW